MVRPKLKESFTAMDVVFSLSWDVEILGFHGFKNWAICLLLAGDLSPVLSRMSCCCCFFLNQTRCVVTFSVARLSFEILLSCKIWIEAYCLQLVLWGLGHRSLNHESNPGRISTRRLLWMGWRWEIPMMIEGLCRDWIVVQNMESCDFPLGTALLVFSFYRSCRGAGCPLVT